MHIKSMAIIRLEIFMQIKNLLNGITKKKKNGNWNEDLILFNYHNM